MPVVQRSLRPLRASASSRLSALARNLWWTWHAPTRRLLAGLDPSLWEATRRNPVDMIMRLSPDRFAVLEADGEFQAQLAACEQGLAKYLATRTWFARTAKAAERRLRV